MSSTRPIPIGASGSQRSSPVAPTPTSYTNVSHSLPADMHHVHLSRFMTRTDGTRLGGLEPPRAPLVGSMPDPNFVQLDRMPDLALGPPAETIEANSLPARTPAVIQFASSCPGDIGFFKRQPTRGSWTPTLEPYMAEQDDFDLSESPALAAMSALRQRMARNGADVKTTHQAHTSLATKSLTVRGAGGPQPSRQYFASDESSSHAVSAELLERLSITSEEKETGDRQERYRMPGFLAEEHSSDQKRRSKRRGSYGNVSDAGDTGIFEFDDQ